MTSTAEAPTRAISLDNLQTYRRATSFMAAAQVYLRSNVLLCGPLRPEQVKPRLLGHWERRRASTWSMRTSNG